MEEQTRGLVSISSQSQSFINKTNLRVLKRVDSSIKEVLAKSNFATLYEYNTNRREWERGEIEGSVFLVSRYKKPNIQLFMLNRQNPQNFSITISNHILIQMNDPFIIIQTEAKKIYGLWIYNDEERQTLTDKIQEVSQCKVNIINETETSDEEIEPSQPEPFYSILKNSTEKKNNNENYPPTIPISSSDNEIRNYRNPQYLYRDISPATLFNSASQLENRFPRPGVPHYPPMQPDPYRYRPHQPEPPFWQPVYHHYRDNSPPLSREEFKRFLYNLLHDDYFIDISYYHFLQTKNNH